MCRLLLDEQVRFYGVVLLRGDGVSWIWLCRQVSSFSKESQRRASEGEGMIFLSGRYIYQTNPDPRPHHHRHPSP